MRVLAAGIDATTIALWLGHFSPESTKPYLHADMNLKQQAIDRTAPPHTAGLLGVAHLQSAQVRRFRGVSDALARNTRANPILIMSEIR